MDEENYTPVKKISDITTFNVREVYNSAKKKGGPRGYRDEYLDFFFDKVKDSYFKFKKKHLTKGLLAIKISHLKTEQDLAYLKSVCIDAENRGKPFSLIFWSEIKVKKS